MSIKLEEGKFYKTKNRLKVECVKKMPPSQHGFTFLCVIHEGDDWSQTRYREDGSSGLHFADESRYNIISEWTKADDEGWATGEIVWVRDKEYETWQVGHFVCTKVGEKPYGITIKAMDNGDLDEWSVTFHKYIRKPDVSLIKQKDKQHDKQSNTIR